MTGFIMYSIIYILLLIFVVRFDSNISTKIILFVIIDFIFYKIAKKPKNYQKSNSEELIEKLEHILIYLSIVLPIAYGSYYLIFIFNSNKNGKIFGIVLLVISSIIIICFLISFIKGIKDITKISMVIKKEKITNKFRELIEGLRIDEAIALLEIEIPKLKEEETKEIYKKGLSELQEKKRKKEEERIRIAKEKEEKRLRREKKEKEEEEERLRMEKEKEEERIRISNEVKDNVENNSFIETNMPLIAEEGCFATFENIEYYEYRTRYGSTNYEKINEGKIYITNQRLYFITDINAFHLIWFNYIIDIDIVDTYKLKIMRDGNAIFLESYDEMVIYKMYSYIKTIMGNK